MTQFQQTTSRTTTTTTTRQDHIDAAVNSWVSRRFPVPEVKTGTVNLRTLTVQQRNGLLEGPMVTIARNNVTIAQVYKRALMATSEFGNKIIRENPLANEIGLVDNTAHLDTNTLKKVLGWLSRECIGMEDFHPIPKGRNTVEACKILHVATVLGMRSYTAHISAYFHNYINDQTVLLGYHELDALLAAVDANDSLIQHLAKDLAHRRYTKAIPDVDDFAEYLKTQPALASAMDAIDQQHANERNVRAKKKLAAQAAAARFEDRKNRAEERRKANEQHRQEQFMATLQQARGGRAGGYGMAL